MEKISLKLFILLFCLFLSTSGAFSRRDESIEELKKQDIERDLKYERLKNSVVPSPIRLASPRALPADTDDDGMPDSWESANGLDPNDPDDAWLDPDSDEVVNLFEYQLGGDLNNPTTPPVVTVGPSGADYTYVTTAINSVAPGTVIRVAGGSRYLNYTTFSSKIVMIQGGYSSDFSQRDLELYPTTFDGGMQDEILYFSVDSGEPVIILDGINLIRGNGYFGAVNLMAEGSAFMKTGIFNCSITESGSTASYGAVLHMNNWDTSESDRTIANTVIVGNGASGIYSQITEYTIAHWRIVNTTISHNLNGGGGNGYGIDAFTLDYGVLTTNVYNSIIWGNEQDDFDIGRNITFEVDHSDVGNVYAYGGAVYLPGAGVMNINPLFIDPANDDFHLQGSSPLIDEGINQGIPLIDFEGDPRITDGDIDGTATVDMGADEYAPQYTLTIAAGTGGTTNPVPGSYTYYIGEKIQIEAIPETNYRFSSWTGDVPSGHENDNPITVTMDSDKSIAANFIRQYILTIAAGTGGTTDPSPGSYTYDSGTQVSVTARPNSGYEFSGWSGDASGTSNPITITMDSDKSITANFVKEEAPAEKKGGCFIATAAYGSSLHPYVKTLRNFRDSYLMPNKLGRILVDLYYKYSPSVANLIAKHKPLKLVIRINLLALVIFSYLMVHFGPIIDTVIPVFISLLPIFLISFWRKKIRKRSKQVL